MAQLHDLYKYIISLKTIATTAIIQCMATQLFPWGKYETTYNRLGF